MSGVMRSRRGYRGTEVVEDSPLASISQESEEDLMRFSPGSVVRLIRERFPLIPPSSMPPPTSPTSNPSTPNPPPQKVGMTSVAKLLIFKGVGNEEPGQFWFVIKSVWDAQGIKSDNIKTTT